MGHRRRRGGRMAPSTAWAAPASGTCATAAAIASCSAEDGRRRRRVKRLTPRSKFPVRRSRTTAVSAARLISHRPRSRVKCDLFHNGTRRHAMSISTCMGKSTQMQGVETQLLQIGIVLKKLFEFLTSGKVFNRGKRNKSGMKKRRGLVS